MFDTLGAVSRTRVPLGRSVAVAVAVCLSVVVAGARAGAGPSRPATRRIHVVLSGETVWGIARRVVGPNGDPRPVVDAIVRANHLGSGRLQPGERLSIPSA